MALRTLKAFWVLHPQAEQPLLTWHAVVKDVVWRNPANVRATFNSVDFVAENRVIFDIAGNKYRLVARIAYEYRAVQIKFIGTHRDYDDIDPVTVEAV